LVPVAVRVVVVAEARLQRTPDGAVWSPSDPTYRFFARYLSAFEQVRVVARVSETSTIDGDTHRVDGPDVEVWPVPYYVGPREYLLRRSALVRAVRAAVTAEDAVILRAPSPIGSLLAAARERTRLPYALEVVGDPYDVFAPGTVDHPLRPVLRWQLSRRLRHQCRSAVAVSYVTEAYLQARYPADAAAVTASYSSVRLPEAAYLPQPRTAEPDRGTYRLVSVGSLAQLYKGIDTLVAATARLVSAGLPVHLTHIGDGRFRDQLEQLAARLGITENVTFAGTLPAGDLVRQRLDAADLFVMPSRTEGLPRALVEAMAWGLPAIGSTAGGIPELLSPDDLVAPDDVPGLTEAIRRMLTDPARRTAASARNLARAADFAEAALDRRREAFYQAVRRITGSVPVTTPHAG
jgi:phosphatidylinositol alpha-1,6-mannosyltransferase